jgi:hypothetical protein|tara:strand:- start:377 stop:532 length:156 start_codon:yes stop_codon:yes gene_type:complete
MEKTIKLELVVLSKRDEKQTLTTVRKMLDKQFKTDSTLKNYMTFADIRPIR